MAARKKYSKEFKLDAISLVTDQGYTRIEAASSLAIQPNMLGRWIKEQQADDGLRNCPFVIAEHIAVATMVRAEYYSMSQNNCISRHLITNGFSQGVIDLPIKKYRGFST
jgi:transposase-like protein